MAGFSPESDGVGLVGLGLMGTAIGERILAAGYRLAVHNRTAAKADALTSAGATRATDLPALAGGVGVVVTVLSDDAALEHVVAGPGGLLEGARPGLTLVDMSTVSPAVSARVAAATDRAGVRYLRAPVSGNPAVVRAGNLTIVASGPAEALEDARGLLTSIGPKLFHVGEAEQARVVKLALQVLIGGTAELLAEALVLGEAGGVSRAALLEVLASSAVGSPFVSYKTGPLLADDYSATFTTRMMVKDVGLILGFAGDAGVRVPLASSLAGLLEDTIAAGYGDADFMSLFPALRDSGAAGSASSGGGTAGTAS